MATVRDLIKGSMRLIGVLAEGETPSAEMQTDALSSLNDMLESWSTESLVIYSKVREEFALVGGTASYTMGPGGTFNTTRPVRVEAAAIKSDDIESPVDVISYHDWLGLSDKTLQSSIPTKLYAQGTSPLETVYLWPVPSEAKTLVLYSTKPLATLAVGTTLQLPPGYAEAIRYNLAMRLAPEYQKEPSSIVAITATKSLSNIKRQNSKPRTLSCDLALPGRTANIFTGE